MSDPFIGELRPFAFNFTPENWLPCMGQQASLQQYQALFAVIGDAFGPTDYRSYFTLPNLSQMVPMHGDGTAVPGWPYSAPPKVGGVGGANAVATNWNFLPYHTHIPSFGQAAVSVTTSTTPGANTVPFRPYYAASKTGYFAWSADTPSQGQPTMSSSSIGAWGSQAPQSHNNQQPYLPLYMCIAAFGIFPVRGDN